MSVMGISKAQLAAAALLFLIFGAGAVCGGAAVTFFERAPSRHSAPSDRLVHQLGLDADQAPRVRAVLQDARQQADALHQAQRPALDAIFATTQKKVRALLTSEQQVIFDGLARAPEPLGPPGGPGGPPPGHGPPPGGHGAAPGGPGGPPPGHGPPPPHRGPPR